MIKAPLLLLLLETQLLWTLIHRGDEILSPVSSYGPTLMSIAYNKNITTLLTALKSITTGSLTVGRGHYINADI